jgi:hypothetical protein
VIWKFQKTNNRVKTPKQLVMLMVATAQTQATDSVPATIWIGFAMMCVGMFMAVLDVQVVATSYGQVRGSALGQ